MRRRLIALVCLSSLLLALVEAATHDHGDSEPSTHHACVHCTGAMHQSPPLHTPSPAPFSCEAAAAVRPAPFIPSLLNPAHSGNAPPLFSLVAR